MSPGGGRSQRGSCPPQRTGRGGQARPSLEARRWRVWSRPRPCSEPRREAGDSSLRGRRADTARAPPAAQGPPPAGQRRAGCIRGAWPGGAVRGGCAAPRGGGTGRRACSAPRGCTGPGCRGRLSVRFVSVPALVCRSGSDEALGLRERCESPPAPGCALPAAAPPLRTGRR